MSEWHNFLRGLMIALEPLNLFYCFVGCVGGTLVGVLPGIGPTAAVALLLPTTYHLNPISAIIMLSGIAYGAMYGGSTTSILVNVPGEAASVVTCLDGYQMARNGRSGAALGISGLGSFIAGTLSIAGVMLFAPTLAKAAVVFGSHEYFSLMFMSMMLVAYLVRGSMLKALIMVGLGLIVGTVGTDKINGRDRFTFGLFVLNDGVGIIPIVVGLFGVAEVLKNLQSSLRVEIYENKIRGIWPTLKDWKDSSLPILRGTLLGFVLGIFPGMSPIIPTFLSYGIEKRISKHPERFGTGVIEAVAGPESCNNAAATSAFIPLLSLGIPSNAFNAVLLGALMIYGLQPGPLLIKSDPNFFWGVVSSMYVGNIMLVVLNLPLIPLWVKLLRVPYSLLSVLILIFCFLGAFSINGSIEDAIIMFVFGVFGYVLNEFEFEASPFVLAFVLGPLVEMAFRQSMIASGGDFTEFFTRPISAFFIMIAFGVLASAIMQKRTLVRSIERNE
jgi:putative tricarboxylic transport membrane protein